MYLSATDLIEEAKNRILSCDERRSAIAHYLVTDGSISNGQLATQFGVSESMIRKDKAAIRDTMAEELRSADPGRAVADAFMVFHRQLRDLELSKKKASPGSREYLGHCKALMDIQMQILKAQQDLGFLPKNIGSLSVSKFEYSAILMPDGTISARPIEEFSPDIRERILTERRKSELTGTVLDIEPVVIELEDTE